VTPLQPSLPAPDADPAVIATAAGLPTAPQPWRGETWWKQFADPQLDRVVEQALAANPDLDTAQARAREAAANAGLAATRRQPSLDAGAQLNRQRLSDNGLFPPPFGGRWITQGLVSTQLLWTLDLFGAERDRIAAAQGRGEAARLAAQFARGATAAAAAKLYFELGAAIADRDIVATTLEQRRAVLRITDSRVRAGLDSAAELRQSEAQVPALELEFAQAQERITLARSQLAVLAGQPPSWAAELVPGAVAAKDADAWGLPADLSSNLLAHRFDVMAAREQVTAAARAVDASRRDWFPSVNLAASAGLDSTTLGRLFDAGSRTFSIGPALSLPLFDAGRRRSATAAQRAAFDGAEAAYRKSVLNAVREVNDAVVQLRSSAQQRAAAFAAVTAEREALRLVQLRYDKGLAPLLSVLFEQDRVLALERRAAQLDARARVLRVQLEEALGAGLRTDSGEVP
jgi:NodT family efflux transporter outer membrane factor (OMF) lipoprotein